MTFILKVSKAIQSPVSADNEHSLWSDVVSVHFTRHEDGAEALLYCREPVKTAEVAGFCEIDKRVWLSSGDVAYVMNENGKTISSFTAIASGDPRNGVVPPNASRQPYNATGHAAASI